MAGNSVACVSCLGQYNNTYMHHCLAINSLVAPALQHCPVLLFHQVHQGDPVCESLQLVDYIIIRAKLMYVLYIFHMRYV